MTSSRGKGSDSHVHDRNSSQLPVNLPPLTSLGVTTPITNTRVSPTRAPEEEQRSLLEINMDLRSIERELINELTEYQRVAVLTMQNNILKLNGDQRPIEEQRLRRVVAFYRGQLERAENQWIDVLNRNEVLIEERSTESIIEANNRLAQYNRDLPIQQERELHITTLFLRTEHGLGRNDPPWSNARRTLDLVNL